MPSYVQFMFVPDLNSSGRSLIRMSVALASALRSCSYPSGTTERMPPGELKSAARMG